MPPQYEGTTHHDQNDAYSLHTAIDISRACFYYCPEKFKTNQFRFFL